MVVISVGCRLRGIVDLDLIAVDDLDTKVSAGGIVLCVRQGRALRRRVQIEALLRLSHELSWRVELPRDSARPIDEKPCDGEPRVRPTDDGDHSWLLLVDYLDLTCQLAEAPFLEQLVRAIYSLSLWVELKLLQKWEQRRFLFASCSQDHMATHKLEHLYFSSGISSLDQSVILH